MGDQDAVKDAIHSLAAILGTSENKDLWDKFRRAFYRLASDLLGDSAIPEDLGALRLIFQDCVPSIGPQRYFPQVKTAMNVETSMESMSVEELSQGGISGILPYFLPHWVLHRYLKRTLSILMSLKIDNYYKIINWFMVMYKTLFQVESARP